MALLKFYKLPPENITIDLKIRYIISYVHSILCRSFIHFGSIFLWPFMIAPLWVDHPKTNPHMEDPSHPIFGLRSIKCGLFLCSRVWVPRTLSHLLFLSQLPRSGVFCFSLGGNFVESFLSQILERPKKRRKQYNMNPYFTKHKPKLGICWDDMGSCGVITWMEWNVAICRFFCEAPWNNILWNGNFNETLKDVWSYTV